MQAKLVDSIPPGDLAVRSQVRPVLRYGVARRQRNADPAGDCLVSRNLRGLGSAMKTPLGGSDALLELTAAEEIVSITAHQPRLPGCWRCADDNVGDVFPV